MYLNNKVSDIDEKVILVFSLLFETNYLNFSKISSSQSVFNNMYNLLCDIMKNYENHKLIPEAYDLKYIKENFPLSKLILTYQRYKIFFTYEDFANYFFTSYTDEEIDDENYPEIDNLYPNITSISYSAFNKIYNIFKCEELDNNQKCKNLELEINSNNQELETTYQNNKNINLMFINIYKKLGSNPRIHNYLNNILDNIRKNIDTVINNNKIITEKIEKNNLFIKFTEIIKNNNDKIYFLNLIKNLENIQESNNFEGKEYLVEIIEKNNEYHERLTHMIFNKIMDKYNIKYNDLNNENYLIYIEQIKKVLSPIGSNSFFIKNSEVSFKDEKTKNDDLNLSAKNDNLWCNNKKYNFEESIKSSFDNNEEIIELSKKELNSDDLFINNKIESLNSLIPDSFMEDSSLDISSAESDSEKEIKNTMDA